MSKYGGPLELNAGLIWQPAKSDLSPATARPFFLPNNQVSLEQGTKFQKENQPN